MSGLRGNGARIGAILLTLVAMLGPALADTPVVLTEWSVVATFKPAAAVCVVRFPAPRGSPSLALSALPPKKSTELGAVFTLGGLPPLLEGKRGTMRDISLAIGRAWSATGLKADWAKGADAANSKMVIHADPAIAAVVQPLANGGTLTIRVPLANGAHTYSFDLSGSFAPMNAFVDCLRRWSQPK